MKWIPLVLLILFGCSKSPSFKESLSYELNRRASGEIFYETGLIPSGQSSQITNQIQTLSLSFDCRRELNVASARQLLVTAVETFRLVLNGNERIRPYLGSYPFEPKNIEINIFIRKSDGSHFGTGKLVVVSAKEGVLHYEIQSPDTLGHQTIHQESYEDALQIQRGSRVSSTRDLSVSRIVRCGFCS